MAVDHYRQVSFQLPNKTIERVDKLAEEYGLSRGNTLMKLVEAGLRSHDEPLEVTSTNTDGVKNQFGANAYVNNSLRKLL
jgi:predicted DNA-binding protein